MLALRHSDSLFES